MSNKNQRGIRPIAIEIDDTCRNTANLPRPGGYRVNYACGKCNTKLCVFLGVKELYCHHCGEKVNWGVITHLNSKLSYNIAERPDDERDKYKKLYLAMVRNLNETKDFKEPVFIQEES